MDASFRQFMHPIVGMVELLLSDRRTDRFTVGTRATCAPGSADAHRAAWCRTANGWERRRIWTRSSAVLLAAISLLLLPPLCSICRTPAIRNWRSRLRARCRSFTWRAAKSGLFLHAMSMTPAVFQLQVRSVTTPYRRRSTTAYGQLQDSGYQVYCVEREFLDADNYPDQLEVDEFDRYAWHFGTLDSTGRLVATARLVAPSILGLPLFRRCSIFPEEVELYKHLINGSWKCHGCQSAGPP